LIPICVEDGYWRATETRPHAQVQGAPVKVVIYDLSATHGYKFTAIALSLVRGSRIPRGLLGG